MLFKISTVFLLAIVILIQPITLVHAANSTPDIKINTEISNNQIILQYTIQEQFDHESHGIFLTLPKNQDGIWTEYTITNVQIECISPTTNQAVICDGFDSKRATSYSIIHEWNEFRLRIGDKNMLIPTGVYRYTFAIAANKDPQYNYNFIALQDWQETISSISINGKVINQDSHEDSLYGNRVYTIPINYTRNASGGGVQNNVPFWHFIINEVWSYVLVILVLYIILYLLYVRYARGYPTLNTPHPEYEPLGDLTPWEMSYLKNEGTISGKNIFLSYLLYLTHEGYISLTPNTDTISKDKVVITKIKELPTFDSIADSYIAALNSIIKNGLSAGVKSAKFNPDLQASTLNHKTGKKLSALYEVRPLNDGIGYLIAGLFILLFVGFISFSFVQDTFLIGNSYGLLVFISLCTAIPGLFILIRNWGYLKREYKDYQMHAKNYFYYLNKVEKLKLDFSNNPQDGVQHYLRAVPYAAGFGILPQFQKYLDGVYPNLEQNNTTGALLGSYSALAFYTPPSSSSGSSGGGGGGFSGGGASW